MEEILKLYSRLIAVYAEQIKHLEEIKNQTRIFNLILFWY